MIGYNQVYSKSYRGVAFFAGAECPHVGVATRSRPSLQCSLALLRPGIGFGNELCAGSGPLIEVECPVGIFGHVLQKSIGTR